MYPLRLFGDPVLKQRAREVEEFDADLVTLVHGMYDTMDLEEGIGLAAPQVGVRKRLFTFDLHEGDGPDVVINPEIVARPRARCSPSRAASRCPATGSR